MLHIPVFCEIIEVDGKGASKICKSRFGKPGGFFRFRVIAASISTGSDNLAAIPQPPSSMSQPWPRLSHLTAWTLLPRAVGVSWRIANGNAQACASPMGELGQPKGTDYD